MINKYIFIFLFSVFIASVSQVLLKKSANIKHQSRVREYANFYVAFSYIIFFISTILTVVAYRGVELKNGPVIESCGYIFIIILSRIFLGEKITIKRITGTLLIIFGIVIFNI
jgi:drug/metabolite transporter (DMT)-like permease